MRGWIAGRRGWWWWKKRTNRECCTCFLPTPFLLKGDRLFMDVTHRAGASVAAAAAAPKCFMDWRCHPFGNVRLSVCVSKLLLLLLPTGQLSRKERGERLTGDEDLLSLFTTTIWPPSATGLLETLPPTSKLGAAAHCALVYVLLLPRIFFPVFFKLDYSIYFPPFLSFSSHRVRERPFFASREWRGPVCRRPQRRDALPRQIDGRRARHGPQTTTPQTTYSPSSLSLSLWKEAFLLFTKKKKKIHCPQLRKGLKRISGQNKDLNDPPEWPPTWYRLESKSSWPWTSITGQEKMFLDFELVSDGHYNQQSRVLLSKISPKKKKKIF